MARRKKMNELTIKDQAVVEGKLKGDMTNAEIGMMVYNTTSKRNADWMVRRTLAKPEVKNEIERRFAASNIYVDRHLRNIDKLAFGADKEDVRLRASQDLADRAGVHYKFFADDEKVKIGVELSDEQFDTIMTKYANKQETGAEGAANTRNKAWVSNDHRSI